MGKEESLFNKVGSEVDGAEAGNLFGKPCFKIGGKAFSCFFKDEMVFKLSGDHHEEALSLKDAKLFDPSGKGRPMKAWVQLPYQHKTKWAKFAEAAAVDL